MPASPPGPATMAEGSAQGNNALHICMNTVAHGERYREEVDLGCTENWRKQALLPTEALWQPQRSEDLMMLAC